MRYTLGFSKTRQILKFRMKFNLENPTEQISMTFWIFIFKSSSEQARTRSTEDIHA